MNFLICSLNDAFNSIEAVSFTLFLMGRRQERQGLRLQGVYSMNVDTTKKSHEDAAVHAEAAPVDAGDADPAIESDSKANLPVHPVPSETNTSVEDTLENVCAQEDTCDTSLGFPAPVEEEDDIDATPNKSTLDNVSVISI